VALGAKNTTQQGVEGARFTAPLVLGWGSGYFT